ncbi:MAG: choice-of-anchor J domain-containing protein [Muribaculaceae bacterium]|nr:choice-of-anchor J domain-containing protein [Muribaculaceae bacterium]
MMKKDILTGLLACVVSIGTAQAAPLLSDDFEDYTTTSGLGDWKVEGEFQLQSAGSMTTFTWKSVGNGLSGKRSLQGGGACFNDEGPYEVTLVSPELTLEAGKSYKVDFLWQQSTTATLTNQCSDLLVKVREPGGEWTTVFAAADRDMCEASGVAFPWGQSSNWETNHSAVDISAWAGKKVEVGFAWLKKDFDNSFANSATIDDVVIDEYNPASGPVADLSQTAYTFPRTYVGTISNSEAITLTNSGKGNLKITSIEGLEGSDFICMLNPADVNVEPNRSIFFNVRYIPTVNGAATATMKLNIEGGEPVEIKLTGSKTPIPEGYNVENFESNQFPPTGWAKTGNWNALNSSFSGDWCTYVNLTMSPAVHYLTTPRLDLSGDTEHFVAFSYINQLAYMTDDLYGVENYVDLELSTDGGQTWKTLWSLNDYVEEVAQAKVTLGSDLGDNCYVRWAYYIPDLDPTIYDYEYSNYFLDAIVLPPFYGAGGVPAATTAVSPKDGAVDQVNSGLILEWASTLFATSYKVSVGTTAEKFDVVDGAVTEATSYAVPRLEYNTKYYWKVVPTNATGDAANVPVWSFTTMADQSIKTFPYSQGFEEPAKAFPLGWGTTATGTTKWGISEIGVFDGKQIAFASGTVSNTSATLTTPEIQLPADDTMMLTFFWGNNAPAVLAKDETGNARNTTTAHDGNDACYVEIAEADGEWQQLAIISEESEYWVREAISLADYAGKIVQLRWRYDLQQGNRRRGVSLDNIVIESESGAAPAYFNVAEFNFGEVNANTVETSKKYVTLTNGGLQPLKIASVTYGDERFDSDLKEGQTLEANKAVTVTIEFAAGSEAAEVKGELTVAFEGGKSVTLPLVATALPATTLYFDFEDDEHGSLKPAGLTTVDVDKQITVKSSVIDYPNAGEPMAFIVLNVTRDYADWRNVYPRSGDQVLAAFRSANEFISAEDWIISPKMAATAESQFRFYGKSYATNDEFNDFIHHRFEVWVSTEGAEVANFIDKVKKETELAYDKDGKFTEYTIDLSAYAGKEIYVGLRHLGPHNSYVAFFDDFYYENFDSFEMSGIKVVHSELPGETTYYNLQGVQVAGDRLTPGVYIVRRGDGSVTKILVK